ncbi:hypothetical protein MMC30_004796 [Trapelia coarctata]|nr:hypothetical protein [Trapelia coarctata]
MLFTQTLVLAFLSATSLVTAHYAPNHQARDLYAREAYESGDIYARDAYYDSSDIYARDAYAEADPYDSYDEIYARDIYDAPVMQKRTLRTFMGSCRAHKCLVPKLNQYFSDASCVDQIRAGKNCQVQVNVDSHGTPLI